MLDAAKMHSVERGGRSGSRRWDKGFLGADCPVSTDKDLDYYPFFSSLSGSLHRGAACSHVINETVLLYSHDDIHNLGHSLSDFMNVRTMLWLAGLGEREHSVVFFNVDAVREGHNYNDDLGRFKT
jgi:hypothetical protein